MREEEDSASVYNKGFVRYLLLLAVAAAAQAPRGFTCLFPQGERSRLVADPKEARARPWIPLLAFLFIQSILLFWNIGLLNV